jgi:regulator of sigma E protease
MELFSTGTNILLIVLGFGLLIFVHELGHFIAAKWARIRTESFAIGFGPSLISYRRGIGLRFGSTNNEVVQRLGNPAIKCSSEELAQAGIAETEYSLRWLPLGGFVRMLGQDDMDPGASSADPNSFNSKPIYKRMIVVSAGIVMNLLLAVVFFLAAFLVGVKFNAPIIGDVFPDTPAARAGMQPGDTVVGINGTPVRTFADVQIDVAMGDPGTTLVFDVLNQDSKKTRTVEMVPEKDPLTGLLSVGIAPASSSTLSTDSASSSFVHSALAAAGLGDSGIGPGWRIARIGETPINTWNEWADIVDGGDGKPIEVTWAGPAGETKTVAMHANPTLEILRYPTAMPATVPNYEQGLIGLTPLVRINSVLPSSPNRETLRADDIVLRAGNLEGPRDADFRKLLQESKGRTIDVLVLRDAKHVPLQVTVNGSGLIGVMITPAFDTPMIAQPFRRLGDSVPNGTPTKTPVADLELLPLTRILAVGDTKVTNWTTFREGLRAATHGATGPRTVALEIENPTPGHERQQVRIDLTAEEIKSLQALGWVPPLALPYFEPIWTTVSAEGDPLTAISMGFSETRKMVILTYLTIYRLAQGTVGVEQLRGPVGIVHLGSRIADRGFMYLVFFLAMISVNLAVLNFLPLPIVDGGLFLYLVYEKIKGRPPSIGFQNVAALIGLLIIGTIFVVTFYNDVMRLVG